VGPIALRQLHPGFDIVERCVMVDWDRARQPTRVPNAGLSFARRWEPQLGRLTRIGLLASLAMAPRLAAAHDPGASLQSVIAPLLPSVVNFIVWAPPDAESATAGNPTGATSGNPALVQFFGSGFIIDPSGIIVTNNHVINNAASVTVKFSDGTTAPGIVVAGNSVIDLAVVKVNVGHPLPAMQFGDSDKLQVGDTVMTMGNPLGVGLSVSVGVVSATDRNISSTPFDDYIQTDAAINHGNSGGPLVDSQGKVVGVDSSLVAARGGTGNIGLGLAIPSNDAKFVVDRLIKYGRVRAGYIGVSIQDVGADVSQALHLPTPTASVISEVTADSPADKAGIQEGDVVLKVGDLVPRDAGAAMRAIGETDIGSTLSLQLQRRSTNMTVAVTVTDVPLALQEQASAGALAAMKATDNRAAPNFGLHLLPMSAALSQKYGYPASTRGVVVDSVDINSLASEQGMGSGDLILRAMDVPVTTPEEVQQVLKQVQAQNFPLVAFLVRSGGGQRWVAMSTAHIR
jgi:serine protease Do